MTLPWKKEGNVSQRLIVYGLYKRPSPGMIKVTRIAVTCMPDKPRAHDRKTEKVFFFVYQHDI